MPRTSNVRLLFLVFAAVLLIAALPLPAVAGSPRADVQIVVEIHYDMGAPYGPFEASGAAVDAGLICASGDTLDISYEGHHEDEDGLWRATVIKQFSCADGTFDIRSNIINNQIVGFELVFWSVVDGTGAYEGLRGNGTSVGEGTSDPDISIETFTGVLR